MNKVSSYNHQTHKKQTLIQITDTHLMADPNAVFLGHSPEQTFHAVMQDIQQRYPDANALLHTGDLAQESVESTYQRYQDYVASTRYPCFQIPGNHDNLELFPFSTALPQPGVIDLDPWAVILLNSAVKNHIDGFIQSEQLYLLEQQLMQLEDKFVVIACHHHPIDMYSQWIDQHKLKNALELKKILQRFNNIKVVLCGHVHQDSVNMWNQIAFFSTPSTCVQFKPRQQEFTLDQIAPGYRCLSLNPDGSFTTQVHRIDYELPTIDPTICGY
ncbi:3',5'-cyclic-AMP phosphodiesterase [Acinetobacter rudis]|uniref:Icc protein n=1 Tax=Acinetobacter rudis CIP 110305 TaxID=421052 RepID=S3P5E9_9GAMM|nr:icc protein [Acinetobacter rudis CIP 110305]